MVGDSMRFYNLIWENSARGQALGNTKPRGLLAVGRPAQPAALLGVHTLLSLVATVQENETYGMTLYNKFSNPQQASVPLAQANILHDAVR